MNKKTIIDSLIGLVAGGLLVFGIFYGVPKSAIQKFYPEGFFETVVFFISLLLGPFLAIFFHELGHLLAGVFQGNKIQLFVVGFLGVKKENDRIKFFLNKEVEYFGGVASTSPSSIKVDLKKNFALVLAMGPVFSLVFGVISFIVYSLSNNAFNSTFGIVGVISFGIFLATTVPSKSGIFFTDRKRLQRLLDKGKVGEIEKMYFETTVQAIIDGHCKNLDINKIKGIQTDQEPIVQFWGYYFEYKHFEELGKEDRAIESKTILMNYKNLIPKTIWKSLFIEKT